MLTSSVVEEESAWVLHQRPYRETSMIVDFLTLSQGRISAVVRGMRQVKSDRKSLLQPFQQLNIRCTGKTDLKTLSHVEAMASRIMLSGDALYCGFYMNEVITRAIPSHVPINDLFYCYQNCLATLQDEKKLDLVMRKFEFGILNELGLFPDLSVTYQGEPIHPELYYVFHPSHGIELSQKSEHAFIGKWLMDMVNENWHEKSRQLAKMICRKAMKPVLGDKPLHSRALFKRA